MICVEFDDLFGFDFRGLILNQDVHAPLMLPFVKHVRIDDVTAVLFFAKEIAIQTPAWLEFVFLFGYRGID